MRISGQPQGLDPQALAEERVKSQGAKAGENNAVQGQERLAPTGDATIDERTLSLISQSARQSEEIRGEKVAALKKAIAEGSYQVSAEKIADAMLRDVAS